MDKKIANYCTKCGAKLTNGVCFQCAGNNNFSAKADEYASLYSSPDEKTVAILGKKYLDRYMMNGVVKYGFAVLSNKRLYLNGICYNVREGKSVAGRYHKTNKKKDIEIKDVIGIDLEEHSGNLWIVLSLVVFLLGPIVCYLAYSTLEKRILDYVTQIGIVSEKTINEYNTRVLIGIIFLAVVLVSLLIYCAYMYIKSSKAYFTIQYVGGAVAFEQKWYSEINMEKFRDSVHIAKDKIVSENAKVVAAKMEAVPTQKASVADEISKLNELLAQGILSQEEFEKAKKELLGL